MSNGEIGIGILAGYVIGFALLLIFIGIFGVIGFWIRGLVDAYQGAKRWSACHGIISQVDAYTRTSAHVAGANRTESTFLHRGQAARLRVRASCCNCRSSSFPAAMRRPAEPGENVAPQRSKDVPPRRSRPPSPNSSAIVFATRESSDQAYRHAPQYACTHLARVIREMPFQSRSGTLSARNGHALLLMLLCARDSGAGAARFEVSPWGVCVARRSLLQYRHRIAATLISSAQNGQTLVSSRGSIRSPLETC